MEVIPFRHEGLGNSAYLVDLRDGTAAIIDPGRTVADYLSVARERGLEIRAVLETHLHADFVTGSLELGEATGAQVLVAEAAAVRFQHRGVRAGDRVVLGEVEFEAISSPGHTPEHLSYVARSLDSLPVLFSGGSLIAGGAARTDLIDPALTESLSRDQFRTLHGAFRELPDETILMPTHGAGSFCSVGDVGGEQTTLGRERETNPLLQLDDEGEFAHWFPTTFPAAPAYFTRLRPVNQVGPTLRRGISMPRALGPEDFDAARAGGLVVDARSVAEFASGHIAGSFSNPMRSSFGVWLGWLVPAGTPLAFVVDEASLGDVIDEALLVGHERFTAWLTDGIESWIRSELPVSTTGNVGPVPAEAMLADGAVALDVREVGEFGANHVPGAVHVPLGQLAERAAEIPRDVPLVVYCGSGERASSAVSLLERAGAENLFNLDGGIRAWKEAGHEVERGRE